MQVERDQVRQPDPVEQVVALDGREHRGGVFTGQDFPVKAVAAADERADAVLLE